MLFFVFSGFAVVRAACAPLLMHEGSLAADEDKKSPDSIRQAAALPLI
jgi:hypothetical protein